MATVSEWRARLRGATLTGAAAILEENSGLPGPRANTALMQAAALELPPAWADELLASGSEYLATCAAAISGAHADTPGEEHRARNLAADSRWRVREGVATGLQLLGDRAPAALLALLPLWSADRDPLVKRAAVAACCEPRLLKTPAMAKAAIDCCAGATTALCLQPAHVRSLREWRSLRQTLGYGWSVAVAAAPESALPQFASLDTTDPDVAWIVASNRTKKRMERVLAAHGL